MKNKELEEWLDDYTYNLELRRIAFESNPGIVRVMSEAGAAVSLYDWLKWRDGSGHKSNLLLAREVQEALHLLEGDDIEPEVELELPTGHARLFADGQEEL